MTASQFPERPDLEQLKRQAKDLHRAARAGDPAALARFRILPAFARAPDAALTSARLALHDAQSVIAREHGCDSWNALRERVEELTLELGAAVTLFIEAATGRSPDRAERLLALHPGIARANLHTALVLGDAAAVEASLAADPGLATRPGGPRTWEPMLYVCQTSLCRGHQQRSDGLVAIARRLLAMGADPNARAPWLHHGVRRPVLWGAVCVAEVLPLAAVLLEAGADPNDGVTLPLAAAGGDLAALELLRAHGADVDHPWATDGASPLYAILNWATTPEGVRWLLGHGADPDPVFRESGETPLHVVARRWDAALAELLVARGADMNRRRADGRTPYAVAELSGNREVAEWLARSGAAADLSEVDQLCAACARGDGARAQELLRDHPGLRAQFSAEHYGALYRAAERGDAGAIEAFLASGLDASRGDDEIGKTALHVAAMEGWVEAVRVLLAHGASVTVRDREFHGQPLIWAAEGSQHAPAEEGRDHAAVAQLLLAAGSPVDWEAGAEPSDAIADTLEEWQRAAREG